MENIVGQYWYYYDTQDIGDILVDVHYVSTHNI